MRGVNKFAAQIAVFFLSAFFHEVLFRHNHSSCTVTSVWSVELMLGCFISGSIWWACHWRCFGCGRFWEWCHRSGSHMWYCSIQTNVFLSYVLLHLSDSVGLFCGPVLAGKLWQRRRLDVSDHWSARCNPHVRPRLLRPKFCGRVTEWHSLMFSSITEMLNIFLLR